MRQKFRTRIMPKSFTPDPEKWRSLAQIALLYLRGEMSDNVLCEKYHAALLTAPLGTNDAANPCVRLLEAVKSCLWPNHAPYSPGIDPVDPKAELERSIELTLDRVAAYQIVDKGLKG